MNIQDVINEAARIGKMPFVEYNGHVGIVTTIKATTAYAGHRGIGVTFSGNNYDSWFKEEDGTDRRSNYMRDLQFFKP